MIVETWGERPEDDYNNRTEDSYVYLGNDTNYGSGDYLQIGSTADNPLRTLIRFTPKQDIPNATIIYAKLWLEFGSRGQVSDVSVYRLLQDWVENEITRTIFSIGNNWNTVGFAAANDSGVDDDASYDRHATPLDTLGGGADFWQSFNITGLVQEWVDGTVKEYGVAVIDSDEVGSEVSSIFSSDSPFGIPAGNLRPYLEIGYLPYSSSSSSSLSLSSSSSSSISSLSSSSSSSTMQESSTTKALIHSNTTDGSTTFVDSMGNHSPAVGAADVEHDTDEQKFGTTAILFDGDSGYIAIPDHDDFFMDTNAFTIDFWLKFNTVSGEMGIWEQYEDDDNNVRFYWDTSFGVFRLRIMDGAGLTLSRITDYDSIVPVADTWYHVAIIRGWDSNANLWAITVGGTNYVLTGIDSSPWPQLAGDFNFGVNKEGTDIYFDGWMDEPRIVKGEAKWIANFTPPKNPYQE